MLKQYRWFLIVPFAVTMILFAVLLVLAQAAPATPFLYTGF